MGKVTESIYDGTTTVISLADVSHVIKLPLGIQVVTKHTTYNFEGDDFNNAAWIGKDEQEAFMAAWCRYRAELEAETLADLTHNGESNRTPREADGGNLKAGVRRSG